MFRFQNHSFTCHKSLTHTKQHPELELRPMLLFPQVRGHCVC
jgi:hypothetical protein